MKLLSKLFGIHVHVWTKWRVVGQYRNPVSKQPCGILVQQRECEECGYTERKDIYG